MINLKVWPQYFDAICTGAKRFEIRNTKDREFNTGDGIRLREWDPETKEYTGREYHDIISYVLHPQDVPEGLMQPDTCVLGWRGPDEAKVQALIDELSEAADPVYLKEVLERTFTKEEAARYDLTDIFG